MCANERGVGFSHDLSNARGEGFGLGRKEVASLAPSTVFFFSCPVVRDVCGVCFKTRYSVLC